MSLLISRSCFLLLTFFLVFNIGNVQARALENQDAIDKFYAQREGQPFWVSQSRLSVDGLALLQTLHDSWQNGLNPKRYNIEQLSALFGRQGTKAVLEEGAAVKVELLLTEAYIRYVRDLSGMRVKAEDMGLEAEHWRQPISAEEALSYLSIRHGQAMDEFLSSREPQGATYQALKAELTRLYREEKANDVHYEKVYFDTLVRPGRGYDNIPKLRVRLGLDDVPQDMKFMYDPQLVDAVKLFQEQNGLKPDGLIGKETLFALNRSNNDKINQIIVNMERLRWIPDEKPDRFIVVNIPSATLWGIDQGQVRFEMPVVVGLKDRQTNIFISKIQGVRFHPTWTVPKTVRKKDILPKLQADPTYLTNKGIELYDGYAKDALTLDPTIVDWSNITDAELNKLRMVQIPGAHNPLGQIRILMPNKHDIYLHDTNEKGLFSLRSRALSSGCVRMQNPRKVAEFVLEKEGNADKIIESALAEPHMQDVYVKDWVPVYLLYYSVWLGDKSQIIYGDDIYNRDKSLLQMLEKLDGFMIIRDNSN